jgi:hypothetical protein
MPGDASKNLPSLGRTADGGCRTAATGNSRSLARNHRAPESASAQPHVIISEEFDARAF